MWALLSGLLLGCAFPPVDLKWLVWVGLVPLLWTLTETRSTFRAIILGWLAGLAFFLLTLHPLVSVHSWTGWSTEAVSAFTGRMTRQWWFMQEIWAVFALWSAGFWAVWAGLTQRFGRHRGLLVLVAPAAWVLLPEWARSRTVFDFQWGFLGNAAADVPAIRQLAALGGIWLLSAVVVLVNLGCLELVRRDRQPGGARRAALIWSLVLLGAVGGLWRLHQPLAGGAPLRVAVIQRYKTEYALEEFTATGLDRNYLEMIQEALARQLDLLVLPESVAIGATSLDGTPSRTKPPAFQIPRSKWEAQAARWLSGTPTMLIVGLDTVEHNEDHNTLVAWTAEGAVGWYHKRRLVPFSEYHPAGWGPQALRGRSEYFPGQGTQLIRAPQAVIGGFICQEVLVPWVTRESVRDGATLLVTGGNDGVFGDPAVARVHADVAQLRAVETGRYVVRAMKSGISAVIDPHGRELVRSRSAEPVILYEAVRPLTGQTPYVRFGDWVVWLSAAGLVVAGLLYNPRTPTV